VRPVNPEGLLKGSLTGANWPPCPNSSRIEGLGRHRPRRRTPVRLPIRCLTCPSSRRIRTFNGLACRTLQEGLSPPARPASPPWPPPRERGGEVCVLPANGEVKLRFPRLADVKL